jgi:glycosyltransferase involved in cell wall biosynthesis
VIYKHLRGIKPFESAGLPGVSVSVVTACRNEAENIQDLLSDIADQNYPPDKYEVIIIDDNSTDNTFRTASEYTGIKNLATIRNKGRGKKEAIKTGVSRASGELIIATDGDCRAGPEWISSIAQFYDKYKPDL